MLGSPLGGFSLYAEASLGGGALSLVSWLAGEPPTPPNFRHPACQVVVNLTLALDKSATGELRPARELPPGELPRTTVGFELSLPGPVPQKQSHCRHRVPLTNLRGIYGVSVPHHGAQTIPFAPSRGN